MAEAEQVFADLREWRASSRARHDAYMAAADIVIARATFEDGQAAMALISAAKGIIEAAAGPISHLNSLEGK